MVALAGRMKRQQQEVIEYRSRHSAMRISALWLLLATTGVLAAGSLASGQTAPSGGTVRIMRNDVDKLPSVQQLPDPFVFSDGTRVKAPREWGRRRAELLELVLSYEYGHLPPVPRPGAVTAAPAPDYALPPRRRPSAGSQPSITLPEGSRQEKLLVTVTRRGHDRKVEFPLLLHVPPGKGPFPVVIRGDLCWGPVRGEVVSDALSRGYMLAEFDRTKIVPDRKGPRTGGAYAVYPEGRFGGLAAWAWGYHRVVDCLVRRKEVDRKKIIVTGHSRGGKAALLGGATDERIALTVPNNSGCGGAGCYRFQAAGSEDLGAITQRFPYWFEARFREFAGKEDRLPIDQHSVKALVAPRGLLTMEALGDRWANPEGTQQTHQAAREVYEFLGAGEGIAIHFREGKHEQSRADWQTLLDFADQLLRGRPRPGKFNRLAFPKSERIWSWSAPAK